MSDATSTSGYTVPERTLVPPTSVSPEAQAVLSSELFEASGYPPLDDVDAWRRQIESTNTTLVAMFDSLPTDTRLEVVTREIDGVRVYDIMPGNISTASRHMIYLDVHGGALVHGAGEACRAMGSRAALRAGLRTWSVDYRMPPDHPYPAAVDDCLTVYRALLRERRPNQIIVGGGSAGGNIAAAMILRARDEGVPLPQAAILLSPEVDLTESGDSFQVNMGVDGILRRSLMPANLLYAGGHDLTDPYVSPLFADFTKGFPPTFLQAGTRDLFLSNAVRMHRALLAAGNTAELHVFEAMPHGGFFGAPEDAELDEQVRKFVQSHLS